MKCKHCGKVWSIAQSGSLPCECPFCGKNLDIIIKNPGSDASVSDVIKMLAEVYGEDIIMNRRLFLALFGDLAPHLKKERKIFSTAMTPDVMKLFESCSEDEQKKRTGRIQSILDVLSDEAVQLFISSMGAVVGWKVTAENKKADNHPQKTETPNVTPPLTTEQKALKGDIAAIHQMINESKDINDTIKWAQLGVSYKCEKCAFVLGKAYMRSPDHYLDGIMHLENSADAGYIPAAAFLGKKLLELNIIEDSKKWLTVASEAGDTNSMFLLANVYYKENNQQKCLYWSKKSAENGETDGYLLYAMVVSGNNTRKGAEEGLAYYSRFLELAPTTHPSYNDAKKLMNELKGIYETKYKNNDAGKNQTPEKPVPVKPANPQVPAVPMEKALISILEKYENDFTSVPALYISESSAYRNNPEYRKKTDKKISTAIKVYANTAAKERVFAIIDYTLFGSAKNGVLLTDKAVYSKDFLENKPVKIVDIVNVETVYSKKDKRYYTYVYYQENTGAKSSVAILSNSDGKIIHIVTEMISSYVKKLQEYVNHPKLSAPVAPDTNNSNQATVEQALQPYMTSFDPEKYAASVFFPTSPAYKSDRVYREHTDYALKEHRKVVTNKIDGLNEKILAVSMLKKPGFVMTDKNVYTESSIIPLSSMKEVSTSESGKILIMYIVYDDQNGGKKRELVYAAMTDERKEFKIVKDMMQAVIKAKK